MRLLSHESFKKLEVRLLELLDFSSLLLTLQQQRSKTFLQSDEASIASASAPNSVVYHLHIKKMYM